MMVRYQQTRRSAVSLQGVWLFEILKSPKRNRFQRLKRYPHSKAPRLARDGEREGWGGRAVAGGDVGRGQTLLKL